MIEIIPAILPKSFEDLEDKLGVLHSAGIQDVHKLVQIDVVDGHYASHKTWPYKDADTFEKIVSEESGLPLWEVFDFEFDLMVRNAKEVILDYVHAGASRIIVHAHAEGAYEALQALSDVRDTDDGPFTVKTGLALMSGDSPDVVQEFDGLYDFVQVMGVEHIGRQGEPFENKTLILVERLRHRYPDLPIQVDGGVSLEHVKALVDAGVTRLVVGSAIFTADNVREAYDALTATS